MARVAVVNRFGRVIETASAVPGDATDEVVVIVILTSQKLFVMIESFWQVHFVAGRTELSRFVKWLEERLLVKRRLCFYELIVDPLQDFVVAVGKWVMQWFFDRIVRIATDAVDIGDRVARGARDACLRSPMVEHVKFRIVKGSRKEGHWVVATGAPT